MAKLSCLDSVSGEWQNPIFPNNLGLSRKPVLGNCTSVASYLRFCQLFFTFEITDNMKVFPLFGAIRYNRPHVMCKR